jgi:hypothetical protein
MEAAADALSRSIGFRMPTPVVHAVVILIASLIAITPALVAATSVLQFAPWGPERHSFVRVLYAVAFLVPTFWLGLIGFAVLLLFRHEKRQELGVPRWLLVGLLLLSVGSVFAVGPIIDLRMNGVRRMVQNGEPLIRAVESYHAATGGYPRELRDLVPVYLKAIPHTGAVGYPNFEYTRADAEPNRLFKTYELRVRTPRGGINFDTLVYWPEQGYPDDMYGGETERVGAWVYVHE